MERKHEWPPPHLSAWESFTSYGNEKRDSQIHPVAFVDQVRKKRTEAGLDDLAIEHRQDPGAARLPGS